MKTSKINFIQGYIDRIDTELSQWKSCGEQDSNGIFNLLFEIKNVLAVELPQIENAILAHHDSVERDANSVRSILQFYIIDEDNIEPTSTPRPVQQSAISNNIFISHRSTDKAVADVFEAFLTSCGIPYDKIFCSSLPGNDIEIEISREIKENLKASVLNFVILSNDFYQSAYCQNEAGIIWFLDVDKIIIALPEIDENLLEGFLDKEHKIRRLNVKNDILAICDIIRKHFPELITSVSKLNANAEKLVSQYCEIIKSRAVSFAASVSTQQDNELAKRILSREFSDGEMIVLKFFYDEQKLFISDDLLVLNSWLNKSKITSISVADAMQILVEDGLIEYVADALSRPCEFKLTMATYRNLRKLPQNALEELGRCYKSHVSTKKVEMKSDNELDNLIAKGLTEKEIVLIKYIADVGRERLFYGWQTSNETNMIKNWEQINGLSKALSDSDYDDAVLKLEMRKFIEPCAKTSYGNTKEYKLKQTFIEAISNLSSASLGKIDDILSEYKMQDSDDDSELPF